jgi:hypothetical protein
MGVTNENFPNEREDNPNCATNNLSESETDEIEVLLGRDLGSGKTRCGQEHCQTDQKRYRVEYAFNYVDHCVN